MKARPRTGNGRQKVAALALCTRTGGEARAMSGPGDERPGRTEAVRASHADREHVIDVLKAGFVRVG